MMVYPNRPDLRRWDSAYGHDYRFVVNNLPLWPSGSLVWREEVIAVIRPHDGPRVAAPEKGAARVGPVRVSECCFRQNGCGDGGEEVACCRILQHISAVEDIGWCHVRRDACESCCASFPPSPGRPNPVVASLLYGLVLRLMDQGGVAGCDLDRADALRSWAEEHLASE
jgi:hypothetical protein